MEKLQLFEKGFQYGIEKNIPEMIETYLLAIEKGDDMAMYYLGNYYGTIGNTSLKTKYYMMSAEHGNWDALNALENSNLYNRTDNNNLSSFKKCIASAIRGNVNAMYYVGLYYMQNLKHEDAMIEKYFKMAIEKCNHVGAMFKLALHYQSICRHAEMITYFEMAVENGHVEAMYELGNYYEFSSFELFEKYMFMCAELCYAPAMSKMVMYCHNVKNYDSMNFWIAKMETANVMDDELMFFIGKYHQTVSKNEELMKKYFLIPASHGHLMSIYELENYYCPSLRRGGGYDAVSKRTELEILCNKYHISIPPSLLRSTVASSHLESLCESYAPSGEKLKIFESGAIYARDINNPEVVSYLQNDSYLFTQDITFTNSVLSTTDDVQPYMAFPELYCPVTLYEAYDNHIINTWTISGKCDRVPLETYRAFIIHTEEEYKKALEIHNRLVKTGDTVWAYWLGHYHKNVTRDYEQMKTFYEIAINYGSSHALYDMGFYYQYIDKHDDKMISYYQRACELSNIASAIALGKYYQFINVDIDAMLKYYTIAVDNQNLMACRILYDYYVSVCKYEKLINLVILMVECGDKDKIDETIALYESCALDDLLVSLLSHDPKNKDHIFKLGMFYQYTKKDYNLMKIYYANIPQNLEVEYHMGKYYQTIGDIENMIKSYTLGVYNNHKPSICALRDYYESINDIAMANKYSWILEALEDDGEPNYKLGMYYKTTEPDTTKMVKHFEKASWAKHVEAHFELIRYYVSINSIVPVEMWLVHGVKNTSCQELFSWLQMFFVLKNKNDVAMLFISKMETPPESYVVLSPVFKFSQCPKVIDIRDNSLMARHIELVRNNKHSATLPVVSDFVEVNCLPSRYLYNSKGEILTPCESYSTRSKPLCAIWECRNGKL